MKKILWTLLCGAVVPAVYAQGLSESATSEWGKSRSLTENIIPLAPNAAAAVRYVDMPVSYCLGQVDVSVDLYTVKSRELTLPLSLSYHTGGIRVDDIAGVAGLGWNLNAGGVVTREIVYMPDEAQTAQRTDFFEFLSPSDVRTRLSRDSTDAVVLDYFRRVLYGQRDSGFDRYSYNFCGYSGSFVIDRTNANAVKEIQVNDFKIIVPTASNRSFTIITNDGTKYSFTVEEKVSKRRVESGSLGGVLTNYYVTNAWHLSRIVSFNDTDTIRLTYLNQNPTWKKTVSSTTANFSRKFTKSNYEELQWEAPSTSTTEYSYKPVALSRIQFANGIVEFSYDSESEKILHAVGSRPDETYNFPWKLRTILIKNNSGEVIKRADFGMDRFSNDKRICLSSLKVYSGTVLDDNYSFTYDSPTATGSRFAQDYFGYRNDQNGNTSLNPVQEYNDFFKGMFYRRGYSFAHAKAFSLTEINRNKVITKLEYEPNSYNDSRQGVVSIGLRIKSVKTYNGSTFVKSRTMSYSNAQSTIDFSKVDKSFHISRNLSKRFESPGIDTFTLGISVMEGCTAPGAAPESAKICYGNVTEIVSDGSQSVKTEYVYNCEPDKNEYVYNGKLYDDCIAQTPKLAENIVFSKMDGSSTGYVGEPLGYFKQRPQFFCNLKKKTTYKTTSAGSYEKVSEENNKFRRFSADDVVTDLFILHPGIGGDDGLPGIHPGGGDETEGGGDVIIPPGLETNPDLNTFHAKYFYFFYVYSAGANSSRIYDSEQTDYYESGSGVVRKKYQYTPAVSYVSWPTGQSRIDGPIEGELDESMYETFRSNLLHVEDQFCGDIIYRKRYLYPQTYSGVAPYDEMVARNNLSAPAGEELIKQKKVGIYAPTDIYKKGKYIKYDFFPVGGRNLIKPSEVIMRNGTTTVWEQFIQKYDEYGNILQVQEKDEPPVCYLWGYNSTYPVAEIRNATYAQVAQALGGESVVKQIAQSAVLSDTQYNQLKNLRSALSSASVSVYRHIPLVGLSDVTDPSGREIHYSYDSAWRLNLVCDDQGQPVESYEYFKKVSVL